MLKFSKIIKNSLYLQKVSLKEYSIKTKSVFFSLSKDELNDFKLLQEKQLLKQKKEIESSTTNKKSYETNITSLNNDLDIKKKKKDPLIFQNEWTYDCKVIDF